MSYVALYRKFRPDNFLDVKGQDHIVTTLKNQIMANRIGHAYLFTGTRGTGKTTIAKIFAKTVNCENPTEKGPCGECKTCRAIAAGASMNVIEIDAASNTGVDSIREIIDEVSYSPAEGKYKVYIIDEVHMLSIGAFNALLKTLEEPPEYCIFILATTDVHKLPITILSRCQRYDFKRITIDTIAGRLRELVDLEQVQVEEKALRYIAKTADGSMRDALSLLDQCIAFHLGDCLTYEMTLDVLGAVDPEIFRKMLHAILDRNVTSCVQVLDEIILQGREITQFITDFIWYLRNLMLASVSEDIEEAVEMSRENVERLKQEAKSLELSQIVHYIHIFSDLSNQIKYASNKRVLVEIALIKVCNPEMESDISGLTQRIKKVEDTLEQGVTIRTAEMGGSGTADVAQPAPEKKQIPKAIPEDVKAVVKNWVTILGAMDNPAKIYLKKAKLSLGGDNRLVIVLEDGIASDYYIGTPENKTHLEDVLSRYIGKEISVTIQSVDTEEEFHQQFVDLSQLIHMDIEED